MRLQISVLGLALAAASVLGGSCAVLGPEGIVIDTRIPLDRLRAEIRIEPAETAGQVRATALFSDTLGRAVRLGDDQSVTLNGVPLRPVGLGPAYGALLPWADAYDVTVREPTRGVETTNVAGLAAFEITAPGDGGAVSLLGFQLEWSGTATGQEVELELAQTFGGQRAVTRIGPETDTGRRVLEAADLRKFVQGADLEITVRKLRTSTAVAGFRSATVTVEVVAERMATPRP